MFKCFKGLPSGTRQKCAEQSGILQRIGNAQILGPQLTSRIGRGCRVGQEDPSRYLAWLALYLDTDSPYYDQRHNGREQLALGLSGMIDSGHLHGTSGVCAVR